MILDSLIPIGVGHRDPLSQSGLIAALQSQPGFDVREIGEPGQDRASAVVVTDWVQAVALAKTRRRLRDAAEPALVVAFGADREWEIRQALDCHIAGYLIAGFSPKELADAIRTIVGGSRYLCPRAAARLAESVVSTALTDREKEVLQLVVEGLCNKTIGRELDISLGTVKSHLKAAYEKLSVCSRTQAIAAAERRGMLQQLANRRAARAGCPSFPASRVNGLAARGTVLDTRFTIEDGACRRGTAHDRRR